MPEGATVGESVKALGFSIGTTEVGTADGNLLEAAGPIVGLTEGSTVVKLDGDRVPTTVGI